MPRKRNQNPLLTVCCTKTNRQTLPRSPWPWTRSRWPWTRSWNCPNLMREYVSDQESFHSTPVCVTSLFCGFSVRPTRRGLDGAEKSSRYQLEGQGGAREGFYRKDIHVSHSNVLFKLQCVFLYSNTFSLCYWSTHIDRVVRALALQQKAHWFNARNWGSFFLLLPYVSTEFFKFSRETIEYICSLAHDILYFKMHATHFLYLIQHSLSLWKHSFIFRPSEQSEVGFKL